MLLQSDMNQVVIKAMELLYHHWDLLRDTHHHAFMQVMMSGEGCNRLFLHWDMSVRQFFYYLVVYRLLKGSQSDRKGRVDVYAFMREFTKGEYCFILELSGWKLVKSICNVNGFITS